MNIDELYQTIQSMQHGSSGRGMSYWRKAASCGRLVVLGQKHAEPAGDPEELDGRSVGVYYHLLHEIGLRGQASNETWDQTEGAYDANFLEAVRLYRAYCRDWGGPLERWGATLLGVEVPIPAGDVGRDAARALFQGQDVTGRLDALVEIPEEALEGIYERTGLLLPGPGRYILDHKTAKSRQDKHHWDYMFGLQSVTYLYLYNLEHPEAPVRGIIFDQIYKHQEIRTTPKFAKTGRILQDSSYEAFVSVPVEGEENVIKALVDLGAENVRLNRTNPSHCFSGFKPCYLFAAGLCNRY